MTAAIFALVALVAIAYAPLWRNQFVFYDDFVYIVDNPHVRNGFSIDSIRWAFQVDSRTGNWHPLTWLSHMADTALFGPDAPWAIHGVNLLLHATNSLLLLWILWRATGAWTPSWIAALVFAIHPIQVESVAWAAQRKNVLSTLLGLVAVAAYLQYVRRRRRWHYAVVAVAMALSLMAKGMLVTLPAVLLLLDFWPLCRWGKERVARLLWEKVPLLAISLAASAITYTAQAPARASLDVLPISVRLSGAVLSYAIYLRKLVWPFDLAVIYPHPGSRLLASSELWKIAVSAVVLVAITALVVWQRRQRPYLLVGWLWYLGTLVPVIGLVHIGQQLLADRYAYVPFIGLFVAIAWLLSDAWPVGHRARNAASAAGVAVLLLLVAVTWRQVETWHDSDSLFHRAIAVSPDNPVAHLNLGYLLSADGRHAAAVPHLEEAVRLAPADADYRIQLAKTLVQLGRVSEALRHYDRAIQQAPNSAVAREDRGILFLEQCDPARAADDFRIALQQHPDRARLHYLLGVAYAREGKIRAALESLQRARKLDPKGPAQRAIVAIYTQQGDRLAAENRHREAADCYRRALHLVPHDRSLREKAARSLRAAGDIDAAEAMLK